MNIKMTRFFSSAVVYFIVCYSTFTLTALRKIAFFKRGNAHSIILYDTCYGVVYGRQHFEVDRLQNTALYRFFLTLSTSSKPIYLHIECNNSAKNMYAAQPPRARALHTTFLEQLYRQYANDCDFFGTTAIDSWDTRAKQDADIFEVLSLFTDGLIRHFGHLFTVPPTLRETPMNYFVTLFDRFCGPEFFSGDPRTSILRGVYELYKQRALGTPVRSMPVLPITCVNEFLSSTYSWLTHAHTLKERLIIPEEQYIQFYQAVEKLKVHVIELYCLQHTYKNSTLNEILIDCLEKHKSLKYFWHEICLLFDQIATHENAISLYQTLIATGTESSHKRIDIFHVGTEHRSLIEQYYSSQGYRLIEIKDVTAFSLEHPALFSDFMVDLAQQYKYL